MPSAKASEAVARTYLKQSALALVRACRKHFGITGAGDKLRVEKAVRAEDVTAFLLEYRARVRPDTLSQEKIRLQPSEDLLRIFLWARPSADSVINDVIRLSLYSDEIVLIDPFSKHIANVPARMPPQGALVRPDLWPNEFGSHALTVCALEDWIRRDLVVLLPEPANFRTDAPNFYHLALRAMKEGKFDTNVGPEILQDSLEGIALNADGERELVGMASRILPEKLSRTEVESVLASLRAFRATNPRRYARRAALKGSAVFSFASGQNIFEAAWIADQIGGYVVPRLALDRKNIRQFTRGSQQKDKLDALAAAFAAAPLPMLNNVSLSDALDFRKSGRLSRFRSYLHSVWEATSKVSSDPKSIERERELTDALKAQHAEADEEWRGIYKDLGVKGALSIFASNALAPVIQAGVVPVAAGALGWLYSKWSGPTKALRRTPTALLLQLENQSSPNPIRRAVDAIERKL